MVGEVSSRQAWQALEGDKRAVLVDVRTTAEWNFVGLPDLSAIGKRPVLISWQSFPGGEIDPEFVARLGEAGVPARGPVYFICRSGARSLSAAEAAAEAGYDAFNVVDGFEGPPDHAQHRGNVAGWKQAGLPWRQG